MDVSMLWAVGRHKVALRHLSELVQDVYVINRGTHLADPSQVWNH